MEGLLVYPNKMDFPIMENFGKPPTPLGMLEVVIKSAEGLPNADFMGLSDPFVEVRPRPPAQHSALSTQCWSAWPGSASQRSRWV